MGRSKRSLRASKEGIQQAESAFKRTGWTKEFLGGRVGRSRPTITNFFARRPVDRPIFMEICTALDLEWGEIAEIDTEKVEQYCKIEIDALVEEIREKVRPIIDRECGTMRVLDMTQPIGLGKIYTEVNILEKIIGRRRLNLEQLLEGCSLGEFDRFGLSGVKEQRVPGLEAVERYGKLMVLGQPGVGKTTFLKYLAIECSRGNFQSDRVAIFVPLKRFAETDGTPGLLDYIAEEWVSGANRERTEAKSTLERLLQAGRGLVLLDGLDEVREEDSDRIIREIQDIANRFTPSQFVATCRIAAREYTFSQFCEVEVAAFEDEQIRAFAQRWFDIKQLDFAEDFLAQLKANPTIEELATNPLLLTLLCLEFEDSGDFPADRAELYQRAVATLLRKWDAKRRIRRQQVYKQLS
ncbi:NACHT domain-containing protein, partial [Oscillatoriales cyanobacterium LEGE 11467]